MSAAGDQQTRQAGRLCRQGGDAGWTALHRLPQPSGGGKDAADRASILAALERQFAKGDKALVGNTGFRLYLKTVGDQHFAIDPDKVEDEKKFDGIFVLRTNTDLNPLEAMLCYKQLWTVEQTFRTAKHLLASRPIFHKLDETIRGHVFCSFLALVLKKALEDRIAALDRSGSWPDIIADLDSLTETEHDGKRFVLRSAPRPAESLNQRSMPQTGLADLDE